MRRDALAVPGDDARRVAVDRQPEKARRGGVDQAQAQAFAGAHLDLALGAGDAH
jgi:hypothetical protein